MKLPSLAAAFLAIAAVPLAAQEPAPAARTAAQTPAEAAMHVLLSALNGNAEDRAALVRTGFSARALDSEPAESRLRWLGRIANDAGGFTLVSAAPQGERMVEAILKSRNGGRFGKLVLFTSRQEPGKIGDIFLLPARDPAKVASERWPDGPLTTARIAEVIGKRAEALASEDLISGTLLVAKGDKVILRRAYGLADQQWRVPNRTDTALHSGSMGKMFTAAAILKLAGQGKLSLDDPISRHVSEYPHAEGAKITLRHLLSHTGGIGEWDGRQFKTAMTGAEAAATMTQPLQSAPGERFQYSNAGFVLLGAAIEKVSGTSLEQALKELVFDPAGMTRTSLAPVTAIVPNRATGYLRPAEDPLGLGPRYSNEQFLGYGGDGSGGAYTTVDDLFAFDRALTGKRLLGAALTAEMLTPRSDFPGAARPSRYGYGVVFDDCGGKPALGHDGGGPNSGVNAVNRITADGEWTIIFLSNYDPPAADDLVASICAFVGGR